MKLDPRRVEAFLREPGGTRVVLLHGSDAGLIRERATLLTRLVAGSVDDPFRVVDLPRDRAGDLGSEMAASSLTGGRRVIRLRDATDQATEPVKRLLLAPGPGFAVIEAGELPARSKLRTLLEGVPDAVTIACYPADGRSRADAIRALLEENDISAEPDALTWLGANLGGDRALMRREIEKLAIAIGGTGAADLAAVRESVGDLAGLSLDDALFAASSGDVVGTDRALDRAAAEGAAAVQIVRAAASHFQRLHLASLAVARGISPSDAVKASRPPIFYQRVQSFTHAVSCWPADTIARALASLGEAERLCKRSGVPADLVARNAVVGLALRGAALARGGTGRRG